METVLVTTCLINVTHNCRHGYEVILIISLSCIWLSGSSKARQVPVTCCVLSKPPRWMNSTGY